MMMQMCALRCARLVLVLAAVSRAQDPFEIHVYEYETLKPGRFTLEAHLNYVGLGTKRFEETVAPTHNQFHMTYELTGGITENISLGFMLLNAERPGNGTEYAGWRLLPHFYAPKSWRLPADIGLVAEFSFQRTAYEENSRRVELRPIVQKDIGRLQLCFNPVFERALHGPGVRDGWNFEPAMRVGYEAMERFTPSLEYYSEWRPGNQIHQLLPGGDLKITNKLLWSFGVGIGATSAGNRLVYKSRFEYSFGFGK
jgi:hypothetical protein